MSLLRSILLAIVLVGVPAHALTVRPPTFAELVAQADSIVRAKAVDRRCEWRESPRGRVIVTIVKFHIETTLKGTAASEIELRQLGGQIGDERMEIEGLPQFGAGDRDYLFIAGNGRAMCPLVAIPHGRYPVVSDHTGGADFVARADGTPLTATAQVASPLGEAQARPMLNRMAQTPMRAADFEAAIRTELNHPHQATAQ